MDLKVQPAETGIQNRFRPSADGRGGRAAGLSAAQLKIAARGVRQPLGEGEAVRIDRRELGTPDGGHAGGKATIAHPQRHPGAAGDCGAGNGGTAQAGVHPAGAVEGRRRAVHFVGVLGEAMVEYATNARPQQRRSTSSTTQNRPWFEALMRRPEGSDQCRRRTRDRNTLHSVGGTDEEVACCRCPVGLAVDSDEPEVERPLGGHGAIKHCGKNGFARDDDHITGRSSRL